MSRRGLVLWSAVFATGVAAAALAWPALAGTGDDHGRSPGGAGRLGTARTDSAPEMVAAIQRDLGINAAQANSRLEKEAWATGTESRLRQRLGSQFAGAWLTTDAAQLMVGVTSDQAADVVLAAGATPRRVSRSESALRTTKSSLDRRRPSSATVAGWYVDVPTNQVVVLARGSTSPASAWVARSGVAAGSVRVVASSEQPKPLFDVRGGDPYFIDNRARCSIGFAVTTGFVTAGHCGQVGSTTTGFNQAPQGRFTASSFPGNNDYGVVAVNGDWTPQPMVNDFNGGTVPVAGSQEAPVGASICRSGSTTGTHCGVIQAKNATVNYPEGAVTGLTRTDVCAEAGDSGGPWLSGDQAQGVTSGGSGDCTNGGTTFFQPVNEILQDNGLTLVTTGSGGAPAPASCTGLEASGTGSLPAGRTQVRPSSGSFQANAGQHVGCLSGPANANFDLFLDRWNGQAWRNVARSTSAGSQERLTFNGSAGFYRYRVASVSGSGAYTIAANLP